MKFSFVESFGNWVYVKHTSRLILNFGTRKKRMNLIGNYRFSRETTIKNDGHSIDLPKVNVSKENYLYK